MSDPRQPHSAAPTPNADGRDQRGRFVPGNRGGPGNPFGRQVAALRQALLDNVSAEDIRAIVRTLVEHAKEGDVAAAKLVLSYVVGKPVPWQDPDRLDVEECARFKEQATVIGALPELLKAPDPGLPLDLIRSTRPALSAGFAGRLGEMIAHPDKYRDKAALRDLLTDGPPSANGRDGRKPPTAADAAESATMSLVGAAPSPNGKRPAQER